MSDCFNRCPGNLVDCFDERIDTINRTIDEILEECKAFDFQITDSIQHSCFKGFKTVLHGVNSVLDGVPGDGKAKF